VFGATTILARRWQRSVYDAQYLELSLRLDLPLASLDRGLLQAAKGAGVLLAEF
jgi:predicted nucleic acid-binding protein